MKIFLCILTFIFSITNLTYADFIKNQKTLSDFECIEDFVGYLETLEDEQALYVIAACIIDFREVITSSGCECPSILEILNSVRQSLKNNGFPISEEEFDLLQDVFKTMEERARIMKKLNFGRNVKSFQG